MSAHEGAARPVAPGAGSVRPGDLDPAAGCAPEPSRENLAVAHGVTYVNRAGVAELAGRSYAWVERASRDGARSSTGFPDPVPGVAPARSGGVGRQQVWYPLDAVRAWLAHRSAETLPSPPRVPEPADPEELIDPEQFRTEVMRPVPTRNTFKALIGRLRIALDTGQPLPLPKPVTWVPSGRGTSPRWRRGDAVAWQNARPGVGRGERSGRPRAGARPPQPTPEPQEPGELIGETHFRSVIARPPIVRSRWKRMVEASLREWREGRDGSLPRPVAESVAVTRTGPTTVYRWRAGDAAHWWNQQVQAHRARQGDPPEV